MLRLHFPSSVSISRSDGTGGGFQLNTKKLYLTADDLPDFPNRVVYKVPGSWITTFRMAGVGRQCFPATTDGWVLEELNALAGTPEINIIIPFRPGFNNEVAPPSSSLRARRPLIALGDRFERITYFKGVDVPSLCLGCNHWRELDLDSPIRCPRREGVPGLECQMGPAISEQPLMAEFALSPRGELIFYVATPSEEIPEEQALTDEDRLALLLAEEKTPEPTPTTNEEDTQDGTAPNN